MTSTNKYFEWMYKLVCKDRFAPSISYRKLLLCLHQIEFVYLLPRDVNRAEDGVDLRRRFRGVTPDGPSSVLEVMIALAIRCEDLMDNAQIGDRTSQWFWNMVNNLGLGAMQDSRFNKEEVVRRIDIFLKREYAPDGHGGLFTIRNCEFDLRDVEIWFQLLWYLDSIT